MYTRNAQPLQAVQAKASLRATGRTTKMLVEAAMCPRGSRMLIVGFSREAAENHRKRLWEIIKSVHGGSNSVTIAAHGPYDEVFREDYDYIFIDHAVCESTP